MQMDKKEFKKFIKSFVADHPFSDQLIANEQTLLLLLNHDKFINWAKETRRMFGIPNTGFKSKSAKLKYWLKNRDSEAWNKRMNELVDMYPKFSPIYLRYVEAFIKFGKIPSLIEPFYNYRVGRFETHDTVPGPSPGTFWTVNRKQLPQVSVEINAPLTNDEWDAIKKEVRDYFEELGVTRRKALKNFDRSLLAMSEKEEIPDSQREKGYGSKQTDQNLVDGKYYKASDDERTKIAKNLPKDRERTLKIIDERLGSTDTSTT